MCTSVVWAYWPSKNWFCTVGVCSYGTIPTGTCGSYWYQNGKRVITCTLCRIIFSIVKVGDRHNVESIAGHKLESHNFEYYSILVTTSNCKKSVISDSGHTLAKALSSHHSTKWYSTVYLTFLNQTPPGLAQYCFMYKMENFTVQER